MSNKWMIPFPLYYNTRKEKPMIVGISVVSIIYYNNIKIYLILIITPTWFVSFSVIFIVSINGNSITSLSGFRPKEAVSNQI